MMKNPSDELFEYDMNVLNLLCFDPFDLGIRQENMFVHSGWLVHNFMKSKFYWLVQVLTGVLESPDKRVETFGCDSRPSKLQLETKQQTLMTRDQQDLDSKSHDLDSRLDSRPPWLRLIYIPLETSHSQLEISWLRLKTACSRVETTWSRLGCLFPLLGQSVWTNHACYCLICVTVAMSCYG
ncbi:hypothetical protein HanXRQr2_Chr02g0072561 [Helianthus annuus]|uniref:Uncharacterized protein n=1 Tax=Helianthus annuus TaxID=4232 RepID=A0A9K3P009_HELAN|nr:hypothetical protein HanXRQr2_Chr02g0072561 [Helianthus annuus]